MENIKHLGWTSVEQTKKLVEAGLDPNTADMYYVKEPYLEMELHARINKLYELLDGSPIEKENHYPCWSLNALMELLPPSIGHTDGTGTRRNYGLNLFRSYYHCCGYSFGPSLNKDSQDNLCCFGGDSWIEAVYKTVLWALENGHVEKLQHNNGKEDRYY